MDGCENRYALDLGRRDLPLIRDPYIMQNLDVLVMAKHLRQPAARMSMPPVTMYEIIKKTFEAEEKC
jgi:hypothetical protein